MFTQSPITFEVACLLAKTDTRITAVEHTNEALFFHLEHKDSVDQDFLGAVMLASTWIEKLRNPRNVKLIAPANLIVVSS